MFLTRDDQFVSFFIFYRSSKMAQVKTSYGNVVLPQSDSPGSLRTKRDKNITIPERNYLPENDYSENMMLIARDIYTSGQEVTNNTVGHVLPILERYLESGEALDKLKLEVKDAVRKGFHTWYLRLTEGLQRYSDEGLIRRGMGGWEGQRYTS